MERSENAIPTVSVLSWHSQSIRGGGGGGGVTPPNEGWSGVTP